jgi:hypothetical protein
MSTNSPPFVKRKCVLQSQQQTAPGSQILRTILKLSCDIFLGLPRESFLLDLLTKTVYIFLVFLMRVTCPGYLIPDLHPNRTIHTTLTYLYKEVLYTRLIIRAAISYLNIIYSTVCVARQHVHIV